MGSAPSALSMVRLTSARPSSWRVEVPAKMTSSILPPRRDLAPCSPMTQESASTTLDLPEPLGPTTQVIPGSKRRVVADANDLKPRTVIFLRYTLTSRDSHRLLIRATTQGCHGAVTSGCAIGQGGGSRGRAPGPPATRSGPRHGHTGRAGPRGEGDAGGCPTDTEGCGGIRRVERKKGRNGKEKVVRAAEKVQYRNIRGDPQGRLADAFGVPTKGSSRRRRCRNRAGTSAVLRSGERGLPVGRTGGVRNSHAELVVTGLESADLGLEVTHPVLQPAHLLNHTRVGAADVAKQSLRHDVGPPH